MLYIRTNILSIVVLVVLMLTAQLVTARTEGVSAPSADSEPTVVDSATRSYTSWAHALNAVDSATRSYIAWAEAADLARALDNQEQSANQNQAPSPSYSSPLDECYDVGLRDAAGCRNAVQTTQDSLNGRYERRVGLPR